MKKYQFTLAKLRAYKKQMMEREKNKLLALRTERLRAEERLEGLQKQFEDMQRRFQEKMHRGTDVHSLQLYEMQKRTILEEQHSLRLHIQTLDTSVERQRRALVRISQEVSGLDKLEEAQKEEYAKLVVKDNEAMIEEFLSFRMQQPGLEPEPT